MIGTTYSARASVHAGYGSQVHIGVLSFPPGAAEEPARQVISCTGL